MYIATKMGKLQLKVSKDSLLGGRETTTATETATEWVAQFAFLVISLRCRCYCCCLRNVVKVAYMYYLNCKHRLSSARASVASIVRFNFLRRVKHALTLFVHYYPTVALADMC